MDRRLTIAVGLLTAGALVGGVVLVVALVEPPSSAPSLPPSGCGGEVAPIFAGPFGMIFYSNSTRGSGHWYNATLTGASSEWHLSQISFMVAEPNGTAQQFPLGSGVSLVLNASDAVQATFWFGTGWTYQLGVGPDSVPSDQEILSLFYFGTTPPGLVGDSFTAVYPCGGIGTTIG